MKKLLLSFFVSAVITGSAIAQDDIPVIKHPSGDHLQGTVNIKIHPQFRDYFTTLNNKLTGFDDLGITSIHKKFPNRKPPVKEYHESGKKIADLSLVYELEYATTKDAFKVCEALMTSGYFEYAEPHFVNYPMSYIPNDALLSANNPYHFNTLQLYSAWDTIQGDTTIVIGYTDTSFDVYHEDLKDNVKKNYGDPIDGQDNDLDGYIDNFRGWDLVGDDSTLFIYNEFHGTSVAAVGSATTDNGIGYAGSGFKCKFIPVKVGNNSQVITMGYEGIVYCIDHGCKIVNCSWGNSNPFNQLAQDIMNDATLLNDVLIVASSGNVDAENYYYPASYEYVLSVTGVDANDLVDPPGGPTPFTRNDSVDVSAPGFNVYTTATYNGGPYYTITGGTSIAAPLVAGVAGLVWAKFPCLTALEVIEQIKATADNIDAVVGNATYVGKIGTGRVNAYTAVQGDLCDLVDVIEETATQQSMVVFPNPANDNLTLMLKSKTSSKAQISVINAMGEQVLDQKNIAILKGNNVQSIDVSGLAAGIYFVNVLTENQNISKLFVKSE